MLKSGDNGVYMLALSELTQMEFALSELRKANVSIEDMQLIEPDLEDVFMALVGSKQGIKA
jgi:ABC-2 type transport system ATP-binding protein